MDDSQAICTVLRTRHELVRSAHENDRCWTRKLYRIWSCSSSVSCRRRSTRDSVHRILSDKWWACLKSSRVVIASVEQQLMCSSNDTKLLIKVTRSSRSDEWYRYSGHQDAAGLIAFRDFLSRARYDSFCLVSVQKQVLLDVSTGHRVNTGW